MSPKPRVRAVRLQPAFPRGSAWFVLALALVTLLGTVPATPAMHVDDARSPSPTAAVRHLPSILPGGQPSSAALLQRQILSKLASDGIPSKEIFLPDLLTPPTLRDGFVHPQYAVGPAPMGIGDIGIRNTTGTAQPYVLNSTSWAASMTIRSADPLYLDGDDDEFTLQLNAVLSNTTVFGNTTNSFWIQNVLSVSPLQGVVQLVDNIWNFSNPTVAMPVDTFHPNPEQNGSPSPLVYAAGGPTVSLTFPFTVNLYVNSSLTVSGGVAYPTVRFGYTLGSAGGAPIASGVFDTVEFNSGTAPGVTPVPEFRVDGGNLTPIGLPFDTEMVLGGPGSGSNVNFFEVNASTQLQYLNATGQQYENAPSVLDAGVDTAETSAGISEYYTTPGTLQLATGPSLVQPMWNETPGGNVGVETLSGSISPANAFLFIDRESTLNVTNASWAPTQTSGSYSFTVAPGGYSGVAELSYYAPQSLRYPDTPASPQNVALTRDPSLGVYTPLYAWDNAEYAALSTSGDGTAADPYQIENVQTAALDPLFGETNDDEFPVFSGVFFANSTAHVDLVDPPSFYIVYPAFIATQLLADGLPSSNELQIELYDVANVVIWGDSEISGWFGNAGHVFPITALQFPIASLTLWNVTDSLVGDNTFSDQGVSLLLLQGGGNVVWGNHIEPGPQTPAYYGYESEVGISAFESGDLFYDNFVTTTYEAYAPDYNEYTGAGQTNQESWNLPGPEPATQVRVVDGYALSGSIVDGFTQCGNYWGNDAPGSGTPFTDGGDIAQGGDYCPLNQATDTYDIAFAETGLPSTATWTVSLANLSQTTAAGEPISFLLPNGTYGYIGGDVPGYVSSDAAGSVTVTGQNVSVRIDYVVPAPPPPPPVALHLVEFTESGLSAGTNWSVSFNGTTLSSMASAIVAQAPAGSYPFSVADVVDYTVAPSSGTVVVGPDGGTETILFTPRAGTLAGTVRPATAQVWIDGALSAASTGAFRVTLAPGLHSIVVLAAGYANYDNNVTVTAGSTTSLSIELQALESTPAAGNTSPSSSMGPTESIVLVGLAAAGGAALVTGLVLRRKRPPPTASPPPGPAV